MAKNKKNERSKKKLRQTECGESVQWELKQQPNNINSSSSRLVSYFALSLSLLAPILYIKISPLAGSGSGCKGWLFGVSDSENFPHESVEHQQLNSANAKIEKSLCVCRTNHAGVVSTWDLCDVELIHSGEIIWYISKNVCGENEKSEKVAMMHSMLSDSSSSRGFFLSFLSCVRFLNPNILSFSRALLIVDWVFRTYRIEDIHFWRAQKSGGWWWWWSETKKSSALQRATTHNTSAEDPRTLEGKPKLCGAWTGVSTQRKKEKNLRSFYRRLRCRRVRLCASRDKWDDLCNQHNIYPRDEKSITLEPSRVDSLGCCCCCCVCVYFWVCGFGMSARGESEMHEPSRHFQHIDMARVSKVSSERARDGLVKWKLFLEAQYYFSCRLSRSQNSICSWIILSFLLRLHSLFFYFLALSEKSRTYRKSRRKFL